VKKAAIEARVFLTRDEAGASLSDAEATATAHTCFGHFADPLPLRAAVGCDDLTGEFVCLGVAEDAARHRLVSFIEVRKAR
jgi:hypothetical protein